MMGHHESHRGSSPNMSCNDGASRNPSWIITKHDVPRWGITKSIVDHRRTCHAMMGHHETHRGSSPIMMCHDGASRNQSWIATKHDEESRNPSWIITNGHAT